MGLARLLRLAPLQGLAGAPAHTSPVFTTQKEASGKLPLPDRQLRMMSSHSHRGHTQLARSCLPQPAGNSWGCEPPSLLSQGHAK